MPDCSFILHCGLVTLCRLLEFTLHKVRTVVLWVGEGNSEAVVTRAFDGPKGYMVVLEVSQTCLRASGCCNGAAPMLTPSVNAQRRGVRLSTERGHGLFMAQQAPQTMSPHPDALKRAEERRLRWISALIVCTIRSCGSGIRWCLRVLVGLWLCSSGCVRSVLQAFPIFFSQIHCLSFFLPFDEKQGLFISFLLRLVGFSSIWAVIFESAW